MADSAIIRLAMATLPRYGSFQALVVSGNGMVNALIVLVSLVRAVRIFGMLQVPEWPAAGDHRDGRKVIGRRRRCYRPFQRPCVPRIVPRLIALPIGADEVPHENENRDRQI